MYSSVFIEYACVLLFLAVIVKIDSQKRFRTDFFVPEEDDYLPSLPQGSHGPNACNCMPIRRCNSLRNRTDWRTVGETCFGYGEFRGVCCPENNDEECGQSKDQNYPDSFVGNASEGSWPWMVAIGITNSSGFFDSIWCSGFLIDRRHVILDAHCYEKKDRKRLRARIGHVNREEADEYRITRVVVHPGFKKNFFYDDIAIMTLDREVNSPSFNPVCLPDEEVSRMNLDGKAMAVAGWGNSYARRVQPVNLNNWIGYRVISNRQCKKIFSETLSSDDFNRHFPRGLSEDVLCAGFAAGGHDICPSSGSPLMVQHGISWFAVGIASFGYRCGLGIPEGFTNVTNYLDWIRENTKD